MSMLNAAAPVPPRRPRDAARPRRHARWSRSPSTRTGTSTVLLDREPYSADGALQRDDLQRVLDDIAADLGTPVRVEVHEADDSTFTDIVTTPGTLRHAHRARGRAESTPRLVASAIAGDGFLPGEEVAVRVVVARQVADDDGTAQTPPAACTARRPPGRRARRAGPREPSRSAKARHEPARAGRRRRPGQPRPHPHRSRRRSSLRSCDWQDRVAAWLSGCRAAERWLGGRLPGPRATRRSRRGARRRRISPLGSTGSSSLLMVGGRRRGCAGAVAAHRRDAAQDIPRPAPAGRRRHRPRRTSRRLRRRHCSRAARPCGHRSTSPTASDVGYLLGRSRGHGVWASVEDSILVLGPPRSGKGLHVVINAILDAPGAVITTATRPDNIAATLTARQATRAGRRLRPATPRRRAARRAALVTRPRLRGPAHRDDPRHRARLGHRPLDRRRRVRRLLGGQDPHRAPSPAPRRRARQPHARASCSPGRSRPRPPPTRSRSCPATRRRHPAGPTRWSR